MENENQVVKEIVVPAVEKPLTQVEKLNKMRKAYRNADLIWKIVTIVVIVAALFFIYAVYAKLLFTESVLRIIVAVVFLLGIPFCLYILPMILKMSSKLKTYTTEYKTEFLQEKIHKEFPKADYKAKDKISIKEISECSMIKKARFASANDCIEGTHNGIDFLRYDMELSYKKGHKNSDCVLIVCNNKTKLDSEVQIIEKDFTIGKNTYEKPETFAEYVSDDEGFNKKFSVYAENLEAAGAFVNKELMRKLDKFSGGGPIAAFFDKKQVYLIIRRKKDSMEAPIYKAVKESTCRKEAEKETEVIKDWLKILDSCVVKSGLF